MEPPLLINMYPLDGNSQRKMQKIKLASKNRGLNHLGVMSTIGESSKGKRNRSRFVQTSNIRDLKEVL